MRSRPSPIPILEAAGVKLVPCGADRWRCNCPVHGGARLSMAVRLRAAIWLVTCFACGFSGTAVDLYAELHKISIGAALRALDGGRQREEAPANLHRRPELVLACSAPGCGATLTAAGRTYKVPGKCGRACRVKCVHIWDSTAYSEILFEASRRGWDVGAEAVGAICPKHLGAA